MWCYVHPQCRVTFIDCYSQNTLGEGWVGSQGNVCPACYFSINYPDFSPYRTPAFSGVPNKGDKFKSGCITLPWKSRFMMRHWQKKKEKKRSQPHTTPITLWPNCVRAKD